MEGFVHFTDVEVAGAMIWGFMTCGMFIGVLFSDGFYHLIKWLSKRKKDS